VTLKPDYQRPIIVVVWHIGVPETKKWPSLHEIVYHLLAVGCLCMAQDWWGSDAIEVLVNFFKEGKAKTSERILLLPCHALIPVNG
jgi:hypothetical protein